MTTATSTKVRLSMPSHDHKMRCGTSRIRVELASYHVITGEYVDGEMEGQGAFRFAGGDVYEGETSTRPTHDNSECRCWRLPTRRAFWMQEGGNVGGKRVAAYSRIRAATSLRRITWLV